MSKNSRKVTCKYLKPSSPLEGGFCFIIGIMNLSVTSIGRAAWRTWSHDQPANVIGVTSRGLFIRAADRVVFVSFETQRGPLTITLGRSIERLRALHVGDAATFVNNRLIFPTTAITIAASPDVVWQAPSPVTSPSPIDQQLKTVQQIASLIVAREPDRGFSPLLAPLLDLPFNGPLSTDHATLLNILRTLRQAVRENDVPSAQTSIDRLLGRGDGLTPAGDDCVLGLLLMLNRWPHGIDGHDLNPLVIEAAYHQTTTLSANLIECAVEGQADERLLNVVDGIVTGQPTISECVDCALSWGNSSGIDALVGMAIAVSVI